MPACSFCSREPEGNYALTALYGDAGDPGAWRRVVAPLCKACRVTLTKAGDEGRVLKTTGERWWLGHGKGKFAAPPDLRGSRGTGPSDLM